MNIPNKAIFLIVAVIIIAVAGVLVFSGKNGSPQVETEANKPESGTAAPETKSLPSQGNEKISVDLSVCKLQQEKVYLCPAEALANFGPVTVKNTGQNNTCSISYDRTNGYIFKGAVKSAELPAGEFLVSVTESGGIANIVRSSASQSLTFFVGGSERVVHVMIVDGKDYSRDQCLEI
jgi:hypothetical protein